MELVVGVLFIGWIVNIAKWLWNEFLGSIKNMKTMLLVDYYVSLAVDIIFIIAGIGFFAWLIYSKYNAY